VLEEPGYEIQRWSAFEHLADLAFDHDSQDAIALYRRLLVEDPSLNGTSVGRPDVTRDSARQALAFANAASPFPRHPGVGLVRAEPHVVDWLQARAGD
jgi:hypothetical protein